MPFRAIQLECRFLTRALLVLRLSVFCPFNFQINRNETWYTCSPVNVYHQSPYSGYFANDYKSIDSSH